MAIATSKLPCLFNTLRHIAFSARHRHTARVLMYDRHGPPATVLKSVTVDLPDFTAKSIRVRMLAAPINPADINQIEGVYPIKPPVPAVGGNEGVGVVEEVGDEVKNLKPGDWVIPNVFGWGTWRTQSVCEASEVIRVPNNIPAEYAATITVNPSTAYRMLKDFEELNPGDVVVQNGATSAVGRAVIQIAKARGLHTINVIRDRPNLEEMQATLKQIGATDVVTEDFARTPAMRELLSSFPSKPKLGLNCVGGKSSTQLLRHLSHGGTMVTYGGMSKEPVVVPTSALIFQDVRVRGFWMTEWYKQNSIDARVHMFEEIAEMVRSGHLNYTFATRKFDDYTSALEAAGSGNAKQLFVF